MCVSLSRLMVRRWPEGAVYRNHSLSWSWWSSGGAMPRVRNTYTLPVCPQVCTRKRVFKRTFISSSDIIALPRGIQETLCSSLSSQIPPSLTFSPPVSHLDLSSEQKLKKTAGSCCVAPSRVRGGAPCSAHTPPPTPPPPTSGAPPPGKSRLASPHFIPNMSRSQICS